MAVYHFTLHAYRTWSPSHPKGYTVRGKGYQPSDVRRAQNYDQRAKFPKVSFDRRMQEVLVLGSIDACRRRGWRLHVVATDPTHFHAVVSWGGFIPGQDVRAKLKNVLSLLLGRVTGQPGRPWFVRDGSRKRVQTREHFDYLLTEYLPDHRGVFWKEGDPIPEDKHGILTPARPALPPGSGYQEKKTDRPSPDSRGRKPARDRGPTEPR